MSIGRQFRGLTRYNYYRTKRYIFDKKHCRGFPAGTKMLYWAEASHSAQHIQTEYFYAITNPEGGPVVRQRVGGCVCERFIPCCRKWSCQWLPGFGLGDWICMQARMGQLVRKVVPLRKGGGV